MKPFERFIRAAHKKPVDVPPCICPGGMMNMITRDVMEASGCSWPEAHSDPYKMAKLALFGVEQGGFENCGVPFCMTVEAEAMGATVNIGDMLTEPHVTSPLLSSAEEISLLKEANPSIGRMSIVAEAIRIIKSYKKEVPVIGNITGPVSTAGTLADMSILLKEFRKKPEACHRLLDKISCGIIKYAKSQVEAGADAICLSEPSGTGELLGAVHFKNYALRYINKIMEALDVQVKIVHICGKVNSITDLLPELRCDVFSFDSAVNIAQMKKLIPQAVMGNINTHTIGTMSAEKVASLTANAMKYAPNIVAPACGLPITTPFENIKAMVNAVKNARQPCL